MGSNRDEDESPLDRISAQNDHADTVVELGLGTVWPFVVLLAGPAFTGLISADVAEQRDFWGLFLSTLAWSSGIALFAFLLITKTFGELSGWPLVTTAVICLFAGSFIAAKIGQGVYSVPVENDLGNPIGWVLGYAKAAVLTFGLIGAVLGLISGVVAGYWGSNLYLGTKPS